MRFPFVVAAGAAVVLGAAFLLGRAGRTPGAQAEAPGQQADYGYVALDAELVQTSDDGAPLYTLQAARIERNPGSGDIAASTLTLHYAPNDAQQWTLSAREAQLPGASTRIALQGDVQIRGKPPGSVQFAQINTQHLDFDTETQDVSTSLPVSLTWGAQRLTGRGLSGNLKQGRVRLESSVHGYFSR